jgi:hypothetical protein
MKKRKFLVVCCNSQSVKFTEKGKANPRSRKLAYLDQKPKPKAFLAGMTNNNYKLN